MNLETEISEPLWLAIRTSYESHNYSSAILDAIYYLGDVIREKTGLESDGTQLVGSAFGGKSPKLKVNKLQTQSDWNIQKGVEQLLRGLYQAIRNPRSHEKSHDIVEDTNAIILFVNYLLKIIGESKSPFTKSEFLNTVFDPYFVPTSQYAQLLVSKIPIKHRLDILIETYRGKNRAADPKNLRFLFGALLKEIKPNELSQLSDVISDELKHISEETAIRETIQILPTYFWQNIDEAVRLRFEHILQESISSGKYDRGNQKCQSGSLGTWANNLIKDFISRSDVLTELLDKLSSEDHFQQDYVFKYFFSTIFNIIKDEDKITEYENELRKWAINIVNKWLKLGDKRFYNEIGYIMRSRLDNPLKEKFQEAYDNFIEKEPVFEEEDDIPF